MAKKEYSFYPGCSSERKASAANYMVSVESMCKTLDIKLNEIPDWNCCGASIGYAEGGELPRHIMNARNIALSEQHNPKQDIVATCAACWLGTKETQERVAHSGQLLADVNEILKDAGLKYEGKQPVRHMVEVLIEDLGYDELKKPVKKPLEGIKIAGYVGCQTNRPFGVDGESFENPKYLDKLTETMGAEAVEKYDQKVTCCGGALAFSEPEKSQAQIKKIIESAYDFGAEMIVTPCPVCQMNVEVYQGQINKKYGTKFNIPVTYYSQLMAVAYGASDSVRAKPKPPVRDSILKWAKALGCPATPASESDANGVHTETYCSSRAEVVYIAVDGLGHTWAGGKSLLPERMVGKTSDKIKATDVIWDFFQKHARFVADKNAVYLDFRNIN